MRTVLQRVSKASVVVEGLTVGAIEGGLLALVGIGHHDTADDAKRMAEKIRYLRIFADQAGHMNRDVVEVQGSVLLVSQFTLQASTTRGRRPSFDGAAPGPVAEPIFESLHQELCRLGVPVETGVFGADMQVALVNDGPVTLVVEMPSS